MSLTVYDFVLLPPPEVEEKIYTLSRQLEQLGTNFTLAPGQAFPHVSLYMAPVEEENLKRAIKLVGAVAATTPPLHLTATDYALDDQGMFEIAYNKDTSLVRLQKDIIANVNALRTGMPEKDPVGHYLVEWLPKTSGEVRENLEKYGYDEIGTLFRPHITLTRFINHDQELTEDYLMKLPLALELSGTFTTLAVYEMGDHGTCIREVARFPLKKIPTPVIEKIKIPE